MQTIKEWGCFFLFGDAVYILGNSQPHIIRLLLKFQDFQEQSTPSPTVTPYLCRQRTMGSRTESMCSTTGAGAPGRQATTWNLEALECGLVE